MNGLHLFQQFWGELLKFTWSRIIGWALILLVISISFQACSFLLKSSYQTSPIIRVSDYSQNPPKTLQYQFKYPTSVYIEDEETPRQFISTWLWTTEPISSVSPTTYTLSFLYQDDDLLFINEEGLPASAEVNLMLDNQRGEPQVIYLHQAPSVPWWFKSVGLTTRVIHPQRPDIFLPGAHTVHIRLWPWWAIGFMEFLEVLFGPTLTLASTALVVIGIAVQQEIQRREKQDEKELDQKLKEIDSIKELLETDIGKATRRWWQYTKWTRGLENSKPDWQKLELQNKLNDLWNNEIKEREWRKALLIEAVGFFNNRELQKTVERASLIHEIDSSDDSSETVASQFLIAYVEKKQHQIINVKQQFGVKKAVEAIKWLYSYKEELKLVVKPVVVQTLAELVGQADTIAEVHKILLHDKEYQHLLKEPEFGEILHQFISEKPEPEKEQLAQELQAKRQENYHWPSLWPPWVNGVIIRDDPNVLKWLQEVISAEFTYNPFIPQKAELDSNFTTYFVDPAVLDHKNGVLRAVQPTILFGGPGSGKTATAFLLMQECQKTGEKESKGNVFPVYFPLHLSASSRLSSSFYLDTAIKAVGEALITFLVLNPYTFLDHNENQKFAIAYLLTYSVGSTQNLEVLLKQTTLSNDNIGKHLLKRLVEKSRDLPEGLIANKEIKLEMLRQARPAGFAHTYILIDLSLTPQISKVRAAEQLQPLLELMFPLARGEVYLKLFMPLMLIDSLTIPSGIGSDVMTWSPQKLKELLDARLSMARVTSFSQFFDRDANEREPDPIQQLTVVANHTPGALLRLINQLLQYQAHENSSDKINNDTLETVLKAATINEGKHE